jgi:hypothetical protein
MATVNDKPQPPLLIERLPELAQEIRSGLRRFAAGRSESSLDFEALIESVEELRILSRCKCGDDFCATFWTGELRESNRGKQRTIWLDPEESFLNLDILGASIITVEVLYRPDVKARLDALFS